MYKLTESLFWLLSFDPFFIEGIIDVSFPQEVTSHCLVVEALIKLLLINKSFGQVWVRNVQSTETDHIGPTIVNELKTFLRSEAFICNENSFEMGAQKFAHILNLRFFSGGTWFSDLDESNILLVKLLDKVGISFLRIFIVLIINISHRGKFNTHCFWLIVFQGDVNQF